MQKYLRFLPNDKQESQDKKHYPSNKNEKVLPEEESRGDKNP